MEVLQEDNSIEPKSSSGPTPLSQEGATAQLEIGIKPAAADKKTAVKINPPGLIKGIIGTPKESASDDVVVDNPSGEKKEIPKEDPQTIISRLDSEVKTESPSPPPSPEESKETANMIVDIFDAVFMLAVTIISKDAEDEDYKVESEKKLQLKKHLSTLLQVAGKKIPVIWLFIGLVVLAYGPVLLKAIKHRKMVSEKKEEDKRALYNNGATKTRKRATKRSSDNVEYYHAEEVK